MNFNRLLDVTIAGVPAIAWIALAFVGALAWWYYQERSSRGVRRRAERSSKKAAAGLTIGVSGLAYTLLGTARGLSDVLSVFGDVLLEAPDVVAYVGTAAVGYFSLKGDLALSASWFAAIAGGLFVLAVMLDD